MNEFLTIYIAGGALAMFLYGILLGTDNAKTEDFGVLVPLTLLWPIFIFPAAGVLLGAGLKKLWKAVTK